MIGYLITFAFVSFRVLVDLPFVVELGSFPERAPTTIWLSWVEADHRGSKEELRGKTQELLNG